MLMLQLNWNVATRSAQIKAFQYSCYSMRLEMLVIKRQELVL